MPFNPFKKVPPAPKLSVWTGRPVGEPAVIVDEEHNARLAAGQAALATARVPASRHPGFAPGAGIRPSEALLARWAEQEQA